ncbi:MAG: hypothetical protein H6908_06635 [Hyphomicrobiales bacterium]|nr:hypothetical protein [Rickettsiales bacterium]MCP5362288.1 hypothetical protein [Hyphomicrobiales bacterium]
MKPRRLLVLFTTSVILTLPLAVNASGGGDVSKRKGFIPNPVAKPTLELSPTDQSIGIAELQAKQRKNYKVVAMPENSIYYQNTVYALAQQVLSRNPDAEFRIISRIPSTGFGPDDQAQVYVARDNIEKVTTLLQDMRIPQEHIHIGYQNDPQITVNTLEISAK